MKLRTCHKVSVGFLIFIVGVVELLLLSHPVGKIMPAGYKLVCITSILFWDTGVKKDVLVAFKYRRG